MELRSRSSRSRSTTPSAIEISDYREGYVTQSIRLTRSKVRSGEGNVSSETIMFPNDEYMEKKLIKKRFVTSDYSSDDGENDEVNSLLQNYKNHTVENTSSTRINGELSALKIYRQAGEYWNKYPKTDYTYSHHSKDRVEISPGVIQMPNMSRKSIHNSPVSGTSPNMQFIANKACSTDSFLGNSASMEAYSTETAVRPRKLFSTTPRQATNNSSVNGDGRAHNYLSSSGRYNSLQSSNVIVRIWHYLITWTYFLYEVQCRCTLWAMKRFYRLACWVLLMDRWLLTKTSQQIKSPSDYADRRNAGKMKKLLALCGVPLLLLGGWFLLSGLVSTISNRPVAVEKILIVEGTPPNQPNFKHHSERLSAADIASALSQEQLLIILENIRNIINIHNIDNNNLSEKLLRDPNFIGMIAERLNDSMRFDILNASYTTSSSNAELTTEERNNKNELYSDEDIVSKFLQNPTFLNIIEKQSLRNNDIKKTVQNQDIIIRHLQEQIQNLRSGFSFVNKVQFHKLEHQLKRCCRNSFIATEKYVLDIIKDIFQAPQHFNQVDFSRWLRTVFIAHDDLTTLLGSLTANLNKKYDAMVEESGRLLMEQVVIKLQEHAASRDADIDYDRIRTQLLGELKSYNYIIEDAHDDEHIKRIVRDVLAIYDADKTGLVDFALETSGAEVLSTKCTEPYQHGTAVWSILGVPLWHMYKPPQTILQPSVNPGECWAFQSFPGYVVLKLTHPIHIEAISYEHVNKLLIANGRIDSAPKHFSIYGVLDPNDANSDSVLLGEFVYDANGEPLQFFTIPGNAIGETLVFAFIELRVNTNHGNPNYTCLYRLRVHGKKATDIPT